MPERPDQPESLAALLLRHRADGQDAEEVPRASLAEALRGGDDPLRLVDYFVALGLPIRDLDDLLAINTDDTEEELHAFRVREGVAVTVASDGAFALYVP